MRASRRPALLSARPRVGCVLHANDGCPSHRLRPLQRRSVCLRRRPSLPPPAKYPPQSPDRAGKRGDDRARQRPVRDVARPAQQRLYVITNNATKSESRHHGSAVHLNLTCAFTDSSWAAGFRLLGVAGLSIRTSRPTTATSAYYGGSADGCKPSRPHPSSRRQSVHRRRQGPVACSRCDRAPRCCMGRNIIRCQDGCHGAIGSVPFQLGVDDRERAMSAGGGGAGLGVEGCDGGLGALRAASFALSFFSTLSRRAPPQRRARPADRVARRILVARHRLALVGLHARRRARRRRRRRLVRGRAPRRAPAARRGPRRRRAPPRRHCPSRRRVRALDRSVVVLIHHLPHLLRVRQGRARRARRRGAVPAAGRNDATRGRASV